MSRRAIRRTKIVATLGPAWEQPARMIALLDAGVDVVRINASHGTPEIRTRWIGQLRTVLASRRAAAAVLFDLQGPRIRVGNLQEPLRLEPGQRVVFAPESVARPGEIPTTYDDLAKDVRVGARILLDDGLLALEVQGVRDERVEAVVHYGGDLKAHKGLNLPGIEVSAPALTEKDVEDVKQAVALGVDYIALSFVRRPEDLEQLRALVPRGVKLVAKIEKDTALKNLCGILDASDAIMVARGDLGVELPFEEVPLIQKKIIREASLHGKPVITATQMLESMVHAPRPTRAETSDVANAILDGTDAVMLSEETAMGNYPVKAIETMARIARHAEAALDPAVFLARTRDERIVAMEVSEAAVHVARSLQAAAIVTPTGGGATPRFVARLRPRIPVVAMTRRRETARFLNFIWGVQPVHTPKLGDLEATLKFGIDRLKRDGLVRAGQHVVFTAGFPSDGQASNLMTVQRVR